MKHQIITNRINQVFEDKKDILNIYFTAGYPGLEDTLQIAKALEESGVDMLEIGMPFSDPVADGPVIQESSQQALENGMTIQTVDVEIDKGLIQSGIDTPEDLKRAEAILAGNL